MTKAKKQVKTGGADYSKVIGGTMAGVGVVIVALLIMILVKTMRDEKKYVISYHTDDELAGQIVEQSELDGKPVGDAGKIIADKYIKVEKALETALNNAGLKRENVWDIDTELERKFGQVVWEISFDAGQYEYEYYINAESGEIVKSFKEIER